MSGKELTPTQTAVYEHIVAHVERHAVQPTLRALCRHFGWSSVPNGAKCHIDALVRKGRLRKMAGRHGWEIVGFTFRRVQCVEVATYEQDRN